MSLLEALAHQSLVRETAYKATRQPRATMESKESMHTERYLTDKRLLKYGVIAAMLLALAVELLK